MPASHACGCRDCQAFLTAMGRTRPTSRQACPASHLSLDCAAQHNLCTAATTGGVRRCLGSANAHETRGSSVRSLGKTTASLARYRRQWQTLAAMAARSKASNEGPPVQSRLARRHGFRLQPRRLAHVGVPPRAPAALAGPGGRPARLHAERGGVRPWSGLVDARRPLRFRRAVPGAGAREQPESLLQLVPARRHDAGRRGGAVDQADGRAGRRRPRHRPAARLRHGPLGRRGHDGRRCLRPTRTCSRAAPSSRACPTAAATTVQEAFESMFQSAPRRPGNGATSSARPRPTGDPGPGCPSGTAAWTRR